MRHFRTRTYAAVAGAVALTMLAAACSNSSTSGSGSSTTGPQALAAGWQGLNPGTGAPQKGGTLNQVGVSDVQYMDYDLAYYTTDIQLMRDTVRGLYGWPAIPGHNTTPAPDLATALPVVSDNGLKQTVTIRSGAMWNTSPPRAVTAADVVRGIKRGCNPSPAFFGGMADFEATIQGLSAFCAGYPSKSASDAAVMKSYIEGHNVSGITVSGNTITFTLTKPAPWLVGAMTLGAFNATPIEAENGLPATPAVYNHMYSDGPYEITSYTPTKSIKMVRNPVWNASTDPLRKAYVNAINVDETGNQTTIYQEMPTGSPSLGMTWDSLPPPANFPNMLNSIKSGSHNVNLGATYSSNPFLMFNTVSPNNGGALAKVAVRQALSYGIERSQLQKVLGGPIINPTLTHVLPAGIDGSQDVPANYNPYPYDPGKAKSMLAAAGFTASHPLQIKFLYRSDSQGSTALFNNVVHPAERARLGEGDRRADQPVGLLRQVPAPSRTPRASPSPAYKGTWDMSCRGLGARLVRELGGDLLQPAVLQPGRLPGERREQLRVLPERDRQQPDQPGAEPAHRGRGRQVLGPGRRAVMQEAAIYPITSELQLAEHAPYVHNAVYMTQWQDFDPTNVWLSKPGSS